MSNKYGVPGRSGIRKNNIYLQKVVGISIFSALAFVVALVCNVIPPIAGFLSLDVKDAVITIAAFIYGPVSGIIIAFIAAFIELVTFSTTAWYGFIMNFASSAVFSIVAATIYKYRRSLNGALIGFFAAITATTGVMLLLNSFVTPVYLTEFVGMPKMAATEMVIDLLPKVLFPFNLAKSILNASLAMLLYKPVVTALRKQRITHNTKNVDEGSAKAVMSFNKNSVIIIVVGSILLVTSIIILLLIW